MKITIEVEITPPAGATHFTLDEDHKPMFYKLRSIGVVGDHWFYWSSRRKEWLFVGHYRPLHIEELPELL